MSILQIIQNLRADNSRLAKESILNANVGNPLLVEFLRVTYEPKINFYITKVEPDLLTKSMMWNMNPPRQFDLGVISEVVDTLHGRKKTGDAARLWLAEMYHNLDAEGQELLKILISRDVKAGISTTTVNKTWAALITQVPYMRCSLPSDTDLSKWPWKDGVYSQIKADGMFANVTHQANGVITIESRAGSPFPLDAFEDLVKDIKNLIPVGYQLHGELLMQRDGKVLPREVGNGMFNSILKVGHDPDAVGCTPIYEAWDLIPSIEAAVKNKYDEKYKERFQTLLELVEDQGECLKVIEYKIVHSLKEAYVHCKQAMDRKLEGTVIKHPDMPWADGTSKFQIKLKKEFTCELRVVGFNPAAASSKNANTFGSMQCESECGQLKVGVTGIKDDVRASIWKHRDTWIGKMIIEVTANGVMAPTKDTGGFHSLFLPRFNQARLDKMKADTLERIKQIEEAATDVENQVNK